MNANPILSVRGLTAGYGRGNVLHEIGFDVPSGAVVAILGRNGVGKTTLIHSLVGMTPKVSGEVLFDGRPIIGMPTSAIARMGVGLVPQGRRIFGKLTVEENLRIVKTRPGGPTPRWDLDSVYDLLPRLAERRRHGGHQLSGGEQQMLSIGRALLGNPRLLLLDEPGDGLAPIVVRQICALLAELCGSGLTVLLIEQNLRTAFTLSSAIHVMEKGTIVHSGSTQAFRRDPIRARQLLGVGG